MSRLKGLVARLRSAARPTAAERRMEEEFAFHLEMEIERLRAAGLPADEARRRALATFGGVDRYREEMRDGRGTVWLDQARADARYALRTMRRSPGAAVAITLTLAIGIGVNGVTYGLVDSLFVRPLPVRNAGQLAGVFVHNSRTGQTSNLAYDDYSDLRDRSNAFAGLAGAMGVPLNVVAGAAETAVADMVWGEMVTENYFSVLEMRPAVGRFFTAADAPQGGNAFAVLSHASWRARFDGDPAVVGRTIRVNGAEFTITGVAPEGFRGVRLLGFWPELWVPAGMHRIIVPGSPGMLFGRGRGWLMGFARMHDGWGIERTEAAADVFARQLAQQHPDTNRDVEVALVSARSGFENPQIVQPRVLALSSALAIFSSVVTLLVICANLANLQLARAAARGRELAIRLALGCSRRRLARQLVVETFVIALPGACLAAAIVLALPAIETLMQPRLQFRVGLDPGPNARVALFTAAIGFGAVLLLGLIPALRAGRTTIAPSLTNVVTPPLRWGRRRVTIRGTLVISQVALSMMLLVGGMLFTRSLFQQRASDTGFDATDRLVMSVSVGLQGYDEAKGRRFYYEVLARVRARPDVVSASWAFPAPFDTFDRGLVLYVEGAGARDDTVRASVTVAAEDVVSALGLRLLAGREIDRRDTADAPPVLMISRALAARLWPGGDAIGKRVRAGSASGPELTVIGVVADARFEAFGEIHFGRAYLSLRQRYRDWQTLVVHTRGDAAASRAAVQAVVRSVDPTLPVFGVTTMEAAVASGMTASRTAASAAGFFGMLSLLIAAIGLYAVVASHVQERTREIGLRLALGSTPHAVLRYAMGNGARLVAWGIAIGLAGALPLARAMAGLLFGLQPFDAPTFAAVPLLLLAVALVATYLPARRAVRLDPVAALRSE